MAYRDSHTGRSAALLTFLINLKKGVYLCLKGFVKDKVLDKAAALAYVTLLSLVPLMATVGALYHSFFSQHSDKIVEIISVVLPYSSTQVEKTLAEFVERASTVGGVGFVLFVAVAFRLFLAIEMMLNEIWGVAAGRSVAVRLFSFTMVLFWGPIVIGIGSTLIMWLEAQPWAPSTRLLLAGGRLAIPLLGFTMAYWLVPHTQVHPKSALLGGVVATLGLQALRVGFLAYLKQFPEVNIIFGSLTLAVIFLVSLFAFWMLVFFGAEVSYVHQNFEVLVKGPGTPEGPHPDWGLACIALVACCYQARKDGKLPDLDWLALRLGLTHRYAKSALDALVKSGVLGVTGAEHEKYVPVQDPSQLTLADVVEKVSGENGSPLQSAAPAPAKLAEKIWARAQAARRESLAGWTFEKLLSEERSSAEEGAL